MKAKVHPRQWPQRKVASGTFQAKDKHGIVHIVETLEPCDHFHAVRHDLYHPAKFRRCEQCHKAREK